MKQKFVLIRLVAVLLAVSLLVACGVFNATTSPINVEAKVNALDSTVTPDVHIDMSDTSNLGKDVSGNGNDATVFGTLTVTTGSNEEDVAVGGFWAGTNGMYINSSDDMSFADDFSVSVTFITNIEPSYSKGDDLLLVAKSNNNEAKREFQLFIRGEDHKIVFSICDADGNWVLCHGPEIPIKEWHTVVARVKNKVMQLYFDDNLVSVKVIETGRTNSTDAPIWIGSTQHSVGSAFPGAISDVRIYDDIMKSSQVKLVKDATSEVRTMAVGEKVFSDRDYYFEDQMPDFFKGMKFEHSSIMGGTYDVVSGGLVYALTPDENISGSAPQEATLRKYGFIRVEELDFQLFGDWNANFVHVYCKLLVPGEVLKIGKWAIMVADDLMTTGSDYIKEWANNTGELLYNGIRLPENWPPSSVDKYGVGEMPVPYLDYKPDVININTGRQLFVDDFLIEETSLTRSWHKAEKYDGNPVMKPETAQELGKVSGHCPMAAPFSGGVWYDGTDKLFKMWYCAGWFDGTALATSKDGINWERADYNVEPGTNLVIPLRTAQRDSAAVIMDPYTTDASAKYKMFLWSRPLGGEVYTSADGIHWGDPTSVAETGDRSTIFYNPFRNKWVYSIRSGWDRGKRSRSYSECDDLIKGANLNREVNWAIADKFDIADPIIKTAPELYNLDAVAYESVMLGAFCIYLGPNNSICAEKGTPKITELHMGFSRDGFHWSRSEDRTPFIGATQQKGDWERGYIHSNAAVCLVNDDELWFYYTGFKGDENRAGYKGDHINGMYSYASTGLAKLRRDGFASMGTETVGTLTTEKVTFDGKFLFVNSNAKSVKAEILDENGNVIEGYSINDCIAVEGDTTKAMLKFSKDLSELSGKNVKFRFTVEEGELYSFWVSDDAVNGASNGYLAGGSVGQEGLVDTAESYGLKQGDVNGDSNVNAADLALLKKYIAELTSEEADYDVNKDGETNAADLAYLKKIIAGII